MRERDKRRWGMYFSAASLMTPMCGCRAGGWHSSYLLHAAGHCTVCDSYISSQRFSMRKGRLHKTMQPGCCLLLGSALSHHLGLMVGIVILTHLFQRAAPKPGTYMPKLGVRGSPFRLPNHQIFLAK